MSIAIWATIAVAIFVPIYKRNKKAKKNKK